MRHVAVDIIVLVCLVLIAGCAPTAVQSARLLEPGQQQFGAGLDFVFGSPQLAPANPVTLPGLQPSLAYRRGILPRLELGSRAWGAAWPGFYAVGGEVDTKIGLRQVNRHRTGLEIAVDPAVGYHQLNLGGAPTHALMLNTSMLFSYNLGVSRGDQITLSPRLDYQRIFGPYQRPFGFWQVGMGLAYAWHPRSNLVIQPQIIWLDSRLSFNGALPTEDREGYGFFQAGLLVRWGKR